MRTPKLLVVGFGDRVSGFARVVHSIVETLTDSYEVVHFAPNLRAAPSKAYPWEIVPCDKPGDYLGLMSLDQLLERFQPDIVWFLNDYWWLAGYASLIEKHRSRCKFVAYMPLDGKIVRPGALKVMSLFDSLVVFTEFARQEVAQWFEVFQQEENGFSAPPITLIPHGVDLSRFYPLGDQEQISRADTRHRLLEEDDPDAFWVLNGNQNHPRKRLDITLRGFAEFARRKPANVKLALPFTFLSPQLGAKGCNIPHLARSLGISDRILYRVRTADDAQLSDEALNELYNCCDVGINTSWGEGWGMVSFEHAATGAAQIVSNHTACAELWKHHADLLEVDRVDLGRAAMLEGRVTRAEQVTAILEHHYHHRECSTEMAHRALANARKPEYRWENIGLQWQETFRAVLNH